MNLISVVRWPVSTILAARVVSRGNVTRGELSFWLWCDLPACSATLEVCTGRGLEMSKLKSIEDAVQASLLRPRGNPPVRALVPALQAEPARPGGDDGRARGLCLAPTRPSCAGCGAKRPSAPSAGTVSAGRWAGPGASMRRTSRCSGRVALPLPCRRSGGQDGGLSSRRQALRRRSQGFLRKGGQEPGCTVDHHARWLCGASHRAVRELKDDGVLPEGAKV